MTETELRILIELVCLMSMALILLIAYLKDKEDKED